MDRNNLLDEKQSPGGRKNQRRALKEMGPSRRRLAWPGLHAASNNHDVYVPELLSARRLFHSFRLYVLRRCLPFWSYARQGVRPGVDAISSLVVAYCHGRSRFQEQASSGWLRNRMRACAYDLYCLQNHIVWAIVISWFMIHKENTD